MGRRVTFDVLAVAKAEGFDEADRKIQHLSGTAKKSMSGLLVTAGALAPALIPIAAVAGGAALAFGGLGVAGILALQGIKAEMKAGTPLGSQYLTMVNVLKTRLAGLEHTAAQGVLTGFKSALQQITPMMPAINSEIKILAEKFGDIASHVLPALVTLFIKAGPLMNTFAGYADTLATKFQAWANNTDAPSRFLKYAADNAPAVGKTLEDVAKAIGHLVVGLGPLGGLSLSSIGAFARFANMIPLPVLKVLAPTIAGIIVATKLWTTAQAALDAAFAANPVGLVVVGLVALGVALTVLWVKWDTVWGWMAHHKAFAVIAGVTIGLMAPFLAVAVGLEAFAKKWGTIWAAIAHATKVAALTVAVGFEQYMLTPVLNVFGAIVHGAAVAFGWMPGIGGKLKAADRAFKDFRKSVDNSLRGLKVDLDTAQATHRLGKFAHDWALLHNKQIDLTTYIKRVILPEVRTPSGSHDSRIPGKATGGPVRDGWFTVGERGYELGYKHGSQLQIFSNQQSKLMTGMSRVPGYAAGTAAAAGIRLRIDTTGLPGLLRAISSTTGTVSGAMRTLLSELLTANKAGLASTSFVRGISQENTQLLGEARRRDSIAGRLKAANQRLADARKALAGEQSTVAAASLSFFNLTGADTSSKNAFLVDLAARAQATTKFAADLKALAHRLPKALLRQLGEAGVEQAGASAALLTTLSAAELKRVGQLYAQTGAASNQAGRAIANSLYGAGVNAARGLVRGLRSQEDALAKVMRHLAKVMVDQIRRELKIHSPSAVGFELGGFFAKGMANGVKAHYPTVRAAASGLAASAVSIPAAGYATAGGDVYITVNAGLGADPDAIERGLIRALASAAKKGHTIPIGKAIRN